MAKTREYMKVLVSEEQIRQNTPYPDPVNYGLRYEISETVENFKMRENKRGARLREFVDNVEMEESTIDYHGRQVPYVYRMFIRDLLKSNKFYYGEYKNWSIGFIDNDFQGIFESEEGDIINDYELWKDLLTTSLYSLLPDENFSLYILGNGKEGRPLPVYYMEFFKDDNLHSDRNAEVFVVWEMDQGHMRKVEGNTRLNRGLRMADYAHAYTKIFIYKVEEDMERATEGKLLIDRLRVANLKRSDQDWDDWLVEQHEAKSTDALVAIIILMASLVASLLLNESIISVFAGIVVAGIASEEWLAPHTVVIGAIARFFKNEALALRMYYRTNFSIGIRSLYITLLASAGELSGFLNDSFGFDPDPSGPIQLTGANLVLILTTAVNIFSLFPCALSYFYEGVRVRDLPKDKYLQPRLFVSKDYPFLLQYLEKCSWPDTPYTKNVARIRLHWSRGGYVNNIEKVLSCGFMCKSKRRMGRDSIVVEDEVEAQPAHNGPEEQMQTQRIGSQVRRMDSFRLEAGFGAEGINTRGQKSKEEVIVDIAAPGSPASMVCFCLCLPAVSKIYHSMLMKNTFFFDGGVHFHQKIHVLFLLVVEIILVSIGGIIIMVSDIIAAILLGIARVMLRFLSYNFVRDVLYVLPFPLAAYYIADLVLIVYIAYTKYACGVLNMTTMVCRAKSMARWYRLPRMMKVRTGRQSNHCWRSGSYFLDQYYVAGDIVVMNPRWPLMGLVAAGETVNGKSKCVWTSRGRRYGNPVLVY